MYSHHSVLSAVMFQFGACVSTSLTFSPCVWPAPRHMIATLPSQEQALEEDYYNGHQQLLYGVSKHTLTKEPMTAKTI